MPCALARRHTSASGAHGMRILPSKQRASTLRTFTPKPAEVTRTWHVIDATDVVLGRLASQTAILLRGKHKTTFAPHVDGGDFVIIINADKVALTGAKLEQRERLVDDLLVDLVREVLLQRAPVDLPLAGAGDDAHAGDGLLATTRCGARSRRAGATDGLAGDGALGLGGVLGELDLVGRVDVLGGVSHVMSSIRFLAQVLADLLRDL